MPVARTSSKLSIDHRLVAKLANSSPGLGP
jgi:hypothetical protein